MKHRIIAGLVMGALAFVLIGLSALTVAAAVAVPLALLLLAALAVIVLITVQSPSASSAWRRLGRANGVLSMALGVVILGLRESIDRAARAQWPPGWEYERDLERSIGPLPPIDVLWLYARYLGAGALVLGAILFAASRWRDPPRSDRTH